MKQQKIVHNTDVFQHISFPVQEIFTFLRIPY